MIAQREVRARSAAAPPYAWRTTTASGCMASRLRPVSSNDSPFVVDDDEPEMLIASADSRFAASSNDVRVRVEFSNITIITVRPRNELSFLIGSSARLQ